ncbi:hypothetical protein CEXT_190451 [Caerostris extrusa]|uniref:Uncharacterized protein n=1 Tax=Caerostris extrusa TaxID=172846 RepID=A0AAV4V4J2_CAEEX|nr:hypothetical protein CEXT_190451 [Caerostris extrusa]
MELEVGIPFSKPACSSSMTCAGSRKTFSLLGSIPSNVFANTEVKEICLYESKSSISLSFFIKRELNVPKGFKFEGTSSWGLKKDPKNLFEDF